MTDSTLASDTRAAVEACREQLPETLRTGRVAFGFDGFVDTVRRMVAERRGPDDFEELRSLAELGDRVASSAAIDSSLSIEWMAEEQRAGGHVAHLSRAYGRLGFEPSIVGMLGRPPADVFVEEVGDAELLSLGEPGRTDAVEFADGKLMLMEKNDALTLDWETVVDRVGVAALRERIDGASLLGIGYLADVPGLPSIVDGLRTEVWPELSDPPERVLVDPGDVRKLSAEQREAGLAAVDAFGRDVDLTLSANRYETRVLAATLADDSERTLLEDATVLRERLSVARAVGHGAAESVVSTTGADARVAVPQVSDPVLTTSAGDHFNAGLTLALLHGIDGGAAVALGNAVASWFVRTGAPPTENDLRDHLDRYLVDS